MSLAEILSRNAKFVKENRSTEPARLSSSTRILVITDSSPEMTGLIEPALGIDRGEANVIRLAGAWGARDGKELYRSVTLSLHLYACSEVYVVGHSGSNCCPADRTTLRKNMNEAGLLENLPDKGENLLSRIRGPSSPEIAVKETVSVLRKTLVPKHVPVHGCMLDSASGALRIIDEDTRDKVRTIEPETIVMGTLADEIPLPELPDIDLPEIPAFDLDSLTQDLDAPVSAAEQTHDDYGSTTKDTGPITFAAMKGIVAESSFQQMQPGPSIEQRALMDGVKVPDIQFQIPEGAKIQDTGLEAIEMPPVPIAKLSPAQQVVAKPKVQAMASRRRKKDIEARGRDSQKRASKKQSNQARPTPHRAEPERPAVTPIVPHSSPQRPLQEREISFGPDESTPAVGDRAETRVDIQRGFVNHRGSEFPLDPQLQRALVKVGQFLASEFSSKDRQGMIHRVRKSSTSGQPVGETLKLVIGPVLKLGKKRYAVINELLKIKEELPRQDPVIAAAILLEILSSS
jgi:carbonic anhydrase